MALAWAWEDACAEAVRPMNSFPDRTYVVRRTGEPEAKS